MEIDCHHRSAFVVGNVLETFQKTFLMCDCVKSHTLLYTVLEMNNQYGK